jgi:hypothetical protein
MITNQELRDAFLSPQMNFYFERKLAPLPSNEVGIRIEEALKYLNMAVHCSGEIPVSREIDDVWHYWIIETVEYERLCLKLHGGTFRHHSSADYSDYVNDNVKSSDTQLPRGVSILGSYVLNYGPFEQERVRYWPLAESLMKRLAWSVDQLNRWLASVQPAGPEGIEMSVLRTAPITEVGDERDQ